MPSLKVNVNPEARSAFESYEGPTPPIGNGYEGVIKNVRVKVGKDSGNPYLNVLIEHDSKDAGKKQYNGAPQWVRVMFGEHDETQARLAAFIKAVTGKANKEANIVDTDTEARSGTGSIVKTIDGVKPDGKRVKFDIREEAAQGGYDARLTADFIRRAIDAPVAAGEPAPEEDEDLVDEEDLEVEDDEAAEDGDDVTREEREAELKKEALADLRAAAKEAEIDIKGLKKAEIIEAILDWEFEGAEDDDESDEEEEEDVELGSDGDEEEVEDEEEDEEDEDPEADIRAELAGLDRTALKARLKESDPEAKVLKKDSDDDLRDKIVNAELGDTPF